ncbi:MAG: hypothetical protein HZC42_05905 [Candidatus Eisenbacteria bacterium]|nr:hypothetical protein [Candidatus Eisenbacteria bacterium]
MSKKFFFICAGLLCLGLAYHLGTRSATAQGAASVDGAEVAQHGGAIDASGVVGRIFYVNGSAVSQPVPGVATVIGTAVLANSSLPYAALLANGDVYGYYVPGGWTLIGNMLGGAATAAKSATWGSLKARYR